MRIVKTLISSVLLRGRHRIPRFFFFLALTGFVLTIIRLGVCNFAPSMCGGYDADSAKQYGKTRNAFEDRMDVSKAC